MIQQEKFFVYILQSLKDYSYYVGQCDDLDKRVQNIMMGRADTQKAKDHCDCDILKHLDQDQKLYKGKNKSKG